VAWALSIEIAGTSVIDRFATTQERSNFSAQFSKQHSFTLGRKAKHQIIRSIYNHSRT
jgi:hypothetical protein